MTNILKNENVDAKHVEDYFEHAQKIRGLISSKLNNYIDLLSIEGEIPGDRYIGSFLPNLKIRLFSKDWLEFNVSKKFTCVGYIYHTLAIGFLFVFALSSIIDGPSLIATFGIVLGLNSLYFVAYSYKRVFKSLSKKLHENSEVILNMAPILCHLNETNFDSYNLDSAMLSCVVLRNGETISPTQMFLLCLTLLDASDAVKKSHDINAFKTNFCGKTK